MLNAYVNKLTGFLKPRSTRALRERGRSPQTSNTEDLLSAALIYEGKEAWAHYRHIEQERNQFLGFFFTLIIGVVGLYSSHCGSNRTIGVDSLILAIDITCGALAIMSFFIYVSLKKFGAALVLYEQEVAKIRKILFAEFAAVGRTDFADFKVATQRIQQNFNRTYVILKGPLRLSSAEQFCC